MVEETANMPAAVITPRSLQCHVPRNACIACSAVRQGGGVSTVHCVAVSDRSSTLRRRRRRKRKKKRGFGVEMSSGDVSEHVQGWVERLAGWESG